MAAPIVGLTRAAGRGPRRALLVGLAVVGVVAAALALLAWQALAAGRATPTTPLGPPRFVEDTESSGLIHTYDGPLAYFTGGGIATFDCDADGRLDAYVAGGEETAALFRNRSAIGGALAFERVSGEETDLRSVTGAYPLDIDGDGTLDLAVLRIGENVLLRGLGACRFERANERWGFDGGDAATTAFAATWEGGAAVPTLAFGNYVDPTADDPASLCHDNELVRARADAGTPGFAPPQPLTPGLCALSMVFSDWDRSGRRDLRISNDDHYYIDGEEQLWRMAPGVAPTLYTADDGWVRVNVQGMGIATYDLTGDGYPEVYLTSQGSNRLQTLSGGPDKPTYRDIGLRRGVNVDRPFAGGDPLPSTAWHPEFADVNNDGFIDLFVSKGNVRQQEGFAMRDPSNLLLGQADGTFAESADRAGILSFDLGRGAALADLNLDGLLDLVEVNLGSPVRLWRNTGAGDGAARPMSHWLALRLHQPGPNPNAIGAWIETRIGNAIARREVLVGGGHASGTLGWTHVGLGPAGDAEVRVQWPDGSLGPWQKVAGDGWIVLERDAAPRAWTPAP
jgi:enediyne biosynthesis protein E4